MNLSKVKALTAGAVIAAASFSVSAAPINIATSAAAGTAPITYANETGVKGTENADGRIVTTATVTADELSVTGTAGIVSANGVTRYARFDITGGLFDAAPSLAQTSSGGANAATETLIQGGDDMAYAIFSVIEDTGTDTIRVTDAWTMASTQYQIDPDVISTMTYNIYETAADAVNQTGSLYSDSTVFTQYVAGSSAAVFVAQDCTATVASGFGEFAAPANVGATASGVVCSLGRLDASKVLVASPPRKANGVVVVANDYLTAGQTVTVTGDVSVGTFTSQTGTDCTGGTKACTAATGNGSCAITATAANADMEICVTLAADDVIAKGAYTLTLATDTLTGALGSVKYDTTTVELPYITTYEGYNQRIFVDNRGSTAAYYSTTFTTESGVTATDGAAATGTLAAGEIAVMKVADLVTFDGGTRGSATLEIEAQSSSLFVTSQIVDLGTGVTDTQSVHPADNSVGSCTHAVTNPVAATTLVAAAGFDADGDNSVTVTATPAAGDEVGATATAMSSRYAYATSTCTD